MAGGRSDDLPFCQLYPLVLAAELVVLRAPVMARAPAARGRCGMTRTGAQSLRNAGKRLEGRQGREASIKEKASE
jgi:uncharacterized low-complexity protein